MYFGIPVKNLSKFDQPKSLKRGNLHTTCSLETPYLIILTTKDFTQTMMLWSSLRDLLTMSGHAEI